MKNTLISKQQCTLFTQAAIKLGASSSSIILSKNIGVKDSLAALCNGDYTCLNYGLDVNQLMLSSGWSGQIAKKSDAFDNKSTSWLVGLILLA